MNELIKALRRCGTGGSLTERCWTCDYYDREPWCEAALVNDAADALEAAEKRIDGLQKLVDINTERCEALRKQLREAHKSYEKHINELEAQLPKEGEWLDEQRGRWIYAKCNLCGKVQDVRSNYCPNCGARMDGKENNDG